MKRVVKRLLQVLLVVALLPFLIDLPAGAEAQPEELLAVDAETVLRRLFWEEKLLRFEPRAPRFACTCSRQRVAGRG